MTGHLPSPEPATHTAKEEKTEEPIPEEDEANANPEAKATHDQPAEEKRRPQRPRMSMQRTYSKPTYPSHKPVDAKNTDLEPYVGGVQSECRSLMSDLQLIRRPYSIRHKPSRGR